MSVSNGSKSEVDMHTFKYKGWYIHENFNTSIGIEVGVMVQSPDYELITVKSIHAAKCLITRRIKKK